MRQIKYILINDTLGKTPSGAPVRCDAANFGHHYVINSAGAVLKLIDVCLPGKEDLNRCAVGIKYNGSLTDPRLKPLLVDLLLELRGHFPDAKILAMDEYDRWHIKVREDMNDLRRELSGYN